MPRNCSATLPARTDDVMETEIPDAIFGFVLPTGIPCAWCARAIYYTRPDIYIDLVPDRMHTHGDKNNETVKRMHDWLNKTGIPELRRVCSEMRIASNSHSHIEYKSDGHIIRATPNGSHGYLYIVGYPLSEA